MNLSEQFKKAKSKMQESIFSFGHDKKPSIISKVGFKKEPFGAIKGDEAYRINIRKDAYTIVYNAPKGKFYPHFHLPSESGNVIKGRIRVSTPTRSFIVNEGYCYYLEPNEWHEVEFLEDDNSLFLHFHPMFKDGEWEATTF